MPESPSGHAGTGPDGREVSEPGPPDPPRMLEIPIAFGKYFLTEKLATGGMAEIYLAKIVGPGGFEKQLVIKQIHPKLSGQRHFVDLFVAEAKTLVTLAHGNIVPVYELGVLDDTYFIAMEYIDGPTLYRLTETLRRRGAIMEPAVAAWITARILEGLDYAHRKGEGVIHRDLSPRNVMLSRDGEVKLVDFGIAVTLGAGGDEGGQSAPTGSFPYMSPEQVRKEPLTGQTDLFSVGVLFWEMLVGRRLFARSDPDATLHAVCAGDIARPSSQNADVPARLDEVVMRALERDMTARWASAGDMLAALQRYLYGLDETPGPRDVAALVAKYCPPETRRLPTHHDPLDVELPFDVTRPRTQPDDTAPRAGPNTAVIPREGAARGKRHARARTETFATHVALEEMLERGRGSAGNTEPPPAPRSEPHDERDDPTPLRPRATPAAGTDAVALRDDAARSEPAPADAPLVLPGRTPPSRGLLAVAGAGALLLSAAAVYVFYNGRSAVERPDAPPRRDAHLDEPLGAADAAPEPRPPTDAIAPVDATNAALVDAGEPGPVLPRPPRDAGSRPLRVDAQAAPLATHPDAIAARPAGTATLSIGAIPWGNVLIDGKRIGRTPIERMSVPSGHHLIEVVFSGEDPPRNLKYPVDLTDGETKDLLADFTKP